MFRIFVAFLAFSRIYGIFKHLLILGYSWPFGSLDTSGSQLVGFFGKNEVGDWVNKYFLRMVKFCEKIDKNILGPNFLTQAYLAYTSSKLCEFILLAPGKFAKGSHPLWATPPPP